MFETLKYIPYLECLWNKKKLFEVTLFATNSCNFKCPFCFNNNKLITVGIKKYEDLSEKLGSFCRLLISGGEPFMRRDLFDVCKPFIDNSKIIHLTIATNGWFTDEIVRTLTRICNYSEDLKVNISLSLDEVGIRRDELVGVVGSWEALLDTNDVLNKMEKEYKNLTHGTITTQCKQNQNRLHEIYDKRIGHYFSFNRARGTNVDMEIYKKFSDFLVKENELNLKVPFLNAKRKMVFDAVYNNSDMPCYAGGLRKVIMADGSIHPCETLAFGGSCPCLHECDLAVNTVFNWRNLRKLLFSR